MNDKTDLEKINQSMLQAKMKVVEDMISAEVVPLDVTCSDGVYRSSYSPMLVEWMARGNSIESFAVNLGVTLDMMQTWVDNYPDFKRAKEIGELAELSYWEKLSKLMAEGVIKGNATITAMVMKSRFSEKYMDKQQLEHTGNVVYQISTGIDRGAKVEKDFREVENLSVEENEDDLL